MAPTYIQPMCDRCWPAFCIGSRGYLYAPARGERGEEICCICEETTKSGIFVRLDPTTLPHPKE